MAKAMWQAPTTNVEQFVADQYATTCGDTNTIYKFKCDATNRYGMNGNVYIETNGQPGLQKDGKNADQLRSGYHACGETHEASTTDEFLKGYYVPTLFGFEVGNTYDVIVWTNHGTNTHCTTELDMTKWETLKS